VNPPWGPPFASAESIPRKPMTGIIKKSMEKYRINFEVSFMEAPEL
jgi:hypothetical protein